MSIHGGALNIPFLLTEKWDHCYIHDIYCHFGKFLTLYCLPLVLEQLDNEPIAQLMITGYWHSGYFLLAHVSIILFILVVYFWFYALWQPLNNMFNSTEIMLCRCSCSLLCCLHRSWEEHFIFQELSLLWWSRRARLLPSVVATLLLKYQEPIEDAAV